METNHSNTIEIIISPKAEMETHTCESVEISSAFEVVSLVVVKLKSK